MSARQKLSRISRHASWYICVHSAGGSTVTRIRSRSTLTTSSEGSRGSCFNPVRQPGAVGGDRIVVQGLDLDRAFALSQLIADQPGFRVLVGRADHGLAE